MGDEVALRAARQHRDLHAGLAERGERLGELELLAGVGAREELDRAERLAAGLRPARARRRCARWRGAAGDRRWRRLPALAVLVGDAGGLRGAPAACSGSLRAALAARCPRPPPPWPARAAAFIADGRSTMVFSKSALRAARRLRGAPRR